MARHLRALPASVQRACADVPNSLTPRQVRGPSPSLTDVAPWPSAVLECVGLPDYMLCEAQSPGPSAYPLRFALDLAVEGARADFPRDGSLLGQDLLLRCFHLLLTCFSLPALTGAFRARARARACSGTESLALPPGSRRFITADAREALRIRSSLPHDERSDDPFHSPRSLSCRGRIGRFDRGDGQLRPHAGNAA